MRVLLRLFVLAALVGASSGCGGGPSDPTSPPVVTPPPVVDTTSVPPAWAAVAQPALAEADRVSVLPSDSLPWVGKLSEDLEKAGISIVQGDGAKGKYDIPTRTILLPASFAGMDLLGQMMTLVHEAAHGLAGAPMYAGHICTGVDCPLGDDPRFGSGAWSHEARFARARLVQIGEGPFGQMRAKIRGLAIHIHGELPSWMKDPNQIVAQK